MFIKVVTWSPNSIADAKGNTARRGGKAGFVSWRGWRKIRWGKAMQGGSGECRPKLLTPSCQAELILWSCVWRYSRVLLHTAVQEEASWTWPWTLAQGRYPGPIPRLSSLLGQQPGPNGHGGRAPLRPDISQASCTSLPRAGSLPWHPGLYKVSPFQKPTWMSKKEPLLNQRNNVFKIKSVHMSLSGFTWDNSQRKSTFTRGFLLFFFFF